MASIVLETSRRFIFIHLLNFTPTTKNRQTERCRSGGGKCREIVWMNQAAQLAKPRGWLAAAALVEVNKLWFIMGSMVAKSVWLVNGQRKLECYPENRLLAWHPRDQRPFAN